MSTKPKTGGPAFPLFEACQHGITRAEYGMSLREWYATHAPQCPEWFKHEPESPCPFVPKPDRLKTSQRDELGLLGIWLDASQVDPAVAAFARERDIAESEKRRWINQQKEKKFFAWRWYYAEMMIATSKSLDTKKGAQ